MLAFHKSTQEPRLVSVYFNDEYCGRVDKEKKTAVRRLLKLTPSEVQTFRLYYKNKAQLRPLGGDALEQAVESIVDKHALAEIFPFDSVHGFIAQPVAAWLLFVLAR